jgi:hypothetical protein
MSEYQSSERDLIHGLLGIGVKDFMQILENTLLACPCQHDMLMLQSIFALHSDLPIHCRGNDHRIGLNATFIG